jgi:hypothetical protein
VKRVAIVAMLGLLLTLAGAAAADAPKVAKKACVDRYDNGRCAFKPDRWGAGAHAEVRSLKWSDWGHKNAIGRGRIHYSPGGDGGPGKVKLSHLKGCGSARAHYTKIKIIFVDRSAYSYGYHTGC